MPRNMVVIPKINRMSQTKEGARGGKSFCLSCQRGASQKVYKPKIWINDKNLITSEKKKKSLESAK